MSTSTPIALVRETTLPDGAKAYLNHPSLDAATTTFIAVFALEDSETYQPGELDLLLEWMQRGTQSYSREALGNAFGALGIVPVLSQINGGVLLVLQALDACRGPALQLAQELVYAPLFDEDELEDVRQEMDEDDRSSTDDPGEIVARAQRLARWYGSSLSAPNGGTAQTRSQQSPEQLKQLHAKIFTRPAIFGLGSSAQDAWLKSADHYLLHGRPERQTEYRPAYRATIAARPRNIVVNAPTMEHASVLRFSPGPPANDIRALAAARLHHEALTDGMSAPLMAQLRGQQALSYSVSSQLVDRNDLWDQLYEVDPDPDRVEESLSAVEELWATPQLLTEVDIARGRAQIATSTRLRIIDANEAILTTMREDVLRGRALDWRDQLAQELAALSHQDILEAAHHYGLSQEPIATVIVGPVEKMNRRFREDAVDIQTLFHRWTLDNS